MHYWRQTRYVEFADMMKTNMDRFNRPCGFCGPSLSRERFVWVTPINCIKTHTHTRSHLLHKLIHNHTRPMHDWGQTMYVELADASVDDHLDSFESRHSITSRHTHTQWHTHIHIYLSMRPTKLIVHKAHVDRQEVQQQLMMMSVVSIMYRHQMSFESRQAYRPT